MLKFAGRDDFPLYTAEWDHIYAIVMDAGDFVLVKIGHSIDPPGRYNSLLTGLPLKSVMLFAPVGGKNNEGGRELEKELHTAFEKYRTRGEWFKFTLEEKAIFHGTTKALYKRRAHRNLEWHKMDAKGMHVLLYARRKAKEKSRAKRFNRYGT